MYPFHKVCCIQLCMVHGYYGVLLFIDGSFKTLMFFGDQLTVERARAAQRARVATNIREALNGLEPAAADWHAEANFLQVRSCGSYAKFLYWVHSCGITNCTCSYAYN